MKPLISVIVPVYNVKDYLSRCAESILEQTYDNFELILVDDGSSDGSGELCDALAQKDSRIRVLHKNNDGVAFARNSGLDIAKGEYITFVDSDDHVDKDYIEFLYNLIVDGGCEMSMCGYYNEYSDGKIVNPFKCENEVHFCSAAFALSEIFYGNLSASSCCKMYKREIFDKIRFEKYTLGEDTFTTYRILLSIKKTAYTSIPKYYYFYRADSATHITCDYYRFYDYVMLSDSLASCIPKTDKRLYNAFCNRFVENNFYAYMKLRNCDFDCKREQNHIAKNIRQYRLPVIFDKRAQCRTRMASAISLFSMHAVDIVYDVMEKLNK